MKGRKKREVLHERKMEEERKKGEKSPPPYPCTRMWERRKRGDEEVGEIHSNVCERGGSNGRQRKGRR